MKVVAFLPIKLNSQRLPRKNLLPLGGKPLCRHILDSLTAVGRIDEIYVYCSSEEIIEYLPEQVIFLKRDKHLDGDLIKGFEIYEAFTSQVDADVYILAHTTSPFIKARTIQNALDKVLDDGYDSAFSAQQVRTFVWYQGKPLNYDINDVPRTQDIEPAYIETSAFFIFRREIFTQYRRRIGFHPYIQEVDDMEAVDIDELKDYRFAQKLIGDTREG